MKRVISAFFLAAILLPAFSEGVETRVVVRAKAKDAKFIGTSMGGALVILRDSESGEIITKGFTIGGTGDTGKIMSESQKRGALLSDDSAAKFETTVDIAEPKLVTIEVHAPYAHRESIIKATTQVWLVPGKDITGDGIVVEIPGFAVDLLTPQEHEGIKLTGGKASVTIRANVVMM